MKARAVPQIGESGYARLAHDAYRTPAWVTEALLRAVELRGFVWECAAGERDMSNVLLREGYQVTSTDIRDEENPWDFLAMPTPFLPGHIRLYSIVTNPPYAQAEAFIRTALAFTEPLRGMVAMLLDHGYDTADGRQDLFRDHPAFACKLTLTRRIRWIGLGDKASPRRNHSWYVWDHRKHDLAPPVLRWTR